MDVPRICGRARQYSSDEWTAQKSVIVELYPKMTLQNVREELANRGFCTTVKQLKSKITEWGLEKSVKLGEMKKVAKHRKWRQDEKQKESIIKRNGVLIKNSNIDRWEKQHPLNPISRSPSPLGPPFTCDTPEPLSDASPTGSYNQMDSVSIRETSAAPSLDLRHRGNDYTDLDRQGHHLMKRLTDALAEATWDIMVGALLSKLGYDRVQLVHMERFRVLYILLEKDRPHMTEAITRLSEIISIRYGHVIRELHERGSANRGGLSKILTPSLMQKRLLLMRPQENSPDFASLDTVIPTLLTAPHARISDADLVSLVKAGDLNRLDQLFRTHQASPLDILNNNMTLLQVATSLIIPNRMEVIDYFLNRGADPNFALEGQWTGAQIVVAVLDFTIAARLLEHPFSRADPDSMFDKFVYSLAVIIFPPTEETSNYIAAMALDNFQFIDESTFNETESAADRKIFHDANQLWALAIAVRCATACTGNAVTVEMAWRAFEYHLRADTLCVGKIKRNMVRIARLYFSGDYTTLLGDARRLFRVALDKGVPEEDWLRKFDVFGMAPVNAESYSIKEYCRLLGKGVGFPRSLMYGTEPVA